MHPLIADFRRLLGLDSVDTHCAVSLVSRTFSAVALVLRAILLLLIVMSPPFQCYQIVAKSSVAYRDGPSDTIGVRRLVVYGLLV